MGVLVYKRTHAADPDPDYHGCFGVYNCMRSVRSRKLDAVIGVGGVGQGAIRCGIARKLSWIGIGPHPHVVPIMRHPVLTFDHFLDLTEDDLELRKEAPALARRLYSRYGPRYLLGDFSSKEWDEVECLLGKARAADVSAVNIAALRSQMTRWGVRWPGADHGARCGKHRPVC